MKLKKIGRSIFVFPLHLGGSNGTKLELNAIFTPPYNAAHYGISLTSSPRQADVVLLLGSATAKTTGPALELIAGLSDEVKLVLLGSDASSAAPFAATYATFGPILPPEAETDPAKLKLLEGLPLPPGKQIAAYVVGAPPDPHVIIEAILAVSAQEIKKPGQAS